MATYSTEHTKGSTYNALRKKFNQAKGSKPQGTMFIEGDITVAPADYDVAGDVIELVQFPDVCRLLSCSVVASEDFDSGGSAYRAGLIIDDGETNSTSTTAAGSAFTNQPANDGLELVSDDNGDEMNVTIIGTTVSTDTVVVETIALTGTTQADTVKTDWGVILAVSIDEAPAGTVTIREASGNATVTTLTSAVLSRGINTVSSFTGNDHLLRLVASEASTKQLGIKGTDHDGNTIYDSQALAGTAFVLSNSRFQTVTEIYSGDLAATTTATVSATEDILVTGSSAFTSSPIPLNFVGGSLPNSEIGVDVGGKTLALLTEVAPTTANVSDITFTVKAQVYVGEVADLGTSN